MITILDTGRVGELRQCEALARGLGLSWEVVKPWAMPLSPPQIIISFGKALLPAMALRRSLSNRPVHVHLGRPRHVAPAKIDLVVVMPQDDYPRTSNTMHLNLPLNSAKIRHSTVSPTDFAGPIGGKTTLLINGPTAHHVLDAAACDRMLNLAKRVASGNGEVLQVILSHRTPHDIRAYMQQICAQTDIPVDRRELSNVLAESRRLIVTADSASLLADALRSGLPTWLHRLPQRRTLNGLLLNIARSTAPRLREHLIREGVAAGGTDFERWHRILISRGLVRPLTPLTALEPQWRRQTTFIDNDLAQCVDRIHHLVRVKDRPMDLLRLRHASTT